MTVLILFPVTTHIGFLGRCRLNSREYALLRNAVVVSPAGGIRTVELVCSLEEAEMLLDHARRFYPVGARYIEEGIRRATLGGGGASTSGLTHWEYRRVNSGQTWHMCSNCDLWPTDDFVRVSELPSGAEICNECRARESLGNCAAPGTAPGFKP